MLMYLEEDSSPIGEKAKTSRKDGLAEEVKSPNVVPTTVARPYCSVNTLIIIFFRFCSFGRAMGLMTSKHRVAMTGDFMALVLALPIVVVPSDRRSHETSLPLLKVSVLTSRSSPDILEGV